MTVQEIMERTGTRETTLTIAWIKDAMHLINSQYDDVVASWKTNITKATSVIDNKYPFPANLIRLKSVSILDTNDSKYKKIRRLVHDPVVAEDTDP
jgi:VanZ family protein